MSVTSLINLSGLSSGEAVSVPVGSNLARDPFAPNYQIFGMGGVGAKPDLWSGEITQYIDEISYEDNSEQFDLLTINFTNQIDGAGGGSILSLIDSKLLAEGTILHIKMGYGNSLRTIGAAQITRKTPHFGTDGVSFQLEAFDMLHNAARKRPKGGVSYKDFRDSQIASIIGARNGFDIKANDPSTFDGIAKTSGLFDRIQAKGVSDYEFLRKIADINGYNLFTRFDPKSKKFNLFFQPSEISNKNKDSIFTFAYNAGDVSFHASLLDFTPTLDATGQASDFELFIVTDKDVGGTKVNFINRLTLDDQKKIKSETERKFTGGNPGSQGGKQKADDDGIRVAFKAYGRSFRFPPNKRFKNEFEARRSVEQFIRRQKESFISGSGTVIGNEALQSRQAHNLTGITDQFSGKYYFNKVVHTYKRESGYSTTFDCRKTIEDTIVQSPPGLTLSDVDKTLERIKGFL